MLTMGSLFDGIGGFPLAAIRNGITPLWASEIEPFPIRVTKHHFRDTGDYWKFGIYTALNEPIVIGVKIVPQFPLNVFCGVTNLPFDVFGVLSKLDRIDRHDFAEGRAQFIFASVEEQA